MTILSKPAEIDKVIDLLEEKLFIQKNFVDELAKKFEKFCFVNSKEKSDFYNEYINKSTGYLCYKI